METKLRYFSILVSACLLMVEYPLLAADNDVASNAQNTKGVGVLLLISFMLFLSLLFVLWLVQIGRQMRQKNH
ncbi:hypothetical protein [Mucilaginibacter jinjuensis]|uniref:CcmD family protein n=1 Tax=Mucilaginibacter jinjuensis TaxID=1176721 RepID=A0ABY7T0A5_9SPHI|nr:hypothetical protein [Mucilaginibacter jinjuensis]WCT09856.1 hypothetical protein PQO05_14070 [Mucilaginibacter jinjuensis]